MKTLTSQSIRRFSFVLFALLSTLACTITPALLLVKEDFANTGSVRTFDNSVQVEGNRKVEFNLEKDLGKTVSPYNFLVSITHLPMVQDFVNLPAGGSLVLFVDGTQMNFPSNTGSREDRKGSTLQVGKMETIRFQAIPTDSLKKIFKAADVRFEVHGSKSSLEGRLPEGSITKLKDFFNKTNLARFSYLSAIRPKAESLEVKLRTD